MINTDVEKRVAGELKDVYAAVITPRQTHGALCEKSLRKTIEFLLSRGIQGFAFNGATGEYCLTSPDELRQILVIAQDVIAGADFVCGVGAASIDGCRERAAVAIDAGAKAILLPPPHFFVYAQDDVELFCRRVAEELPIPVLLYNLPQFTGILQSETVQQLITGCSNIIGIKDSSGSLEIFRYLTQARIGACRLVGNDTVLAAGLREKVCDGVISGVAGVLPEVIMALFRHRDRPLGTEFVVAAGLLDEFIKHIGPFPVPWALKIVAESRGMASAVFAQPLSQRRLAEARDLQSWFRTWQSSATGFASAQHKQ